MPNKPSEESVAIAAQCWCDETTKDIPMDVHLAAVFAKKLDEQHEKLVGLIEYGWTIICNASGGDWDKQSSLWVDAARKYEIEYYAQIRKSKKKISAEATPVTL
jgi:hypothetical protein